MVTIYTENEMKEQLEKKKEKLNLKIQKIIDSGNVKIEEVKEEIAKIDAVIKVLDEQGL